MLKFTWKLRSQAESTDPNYRRSICPAWIEYNIEYFGAKSDPIDSFSTAQFRGETRQTNLPTQMLTFICRHGTRIVT
jgi:hypothetical protein